MAATYRKKKIEDLIQKLKNEKLESLEKIDTMQDSLLDYHVDLCAVHRGKIAACDYMIKYIKEEFDLE